MPFCHAELRTAKPKSERYPKELKSLGDHIRSRRIDLGLFQSQVADLIGVCPLTITNWEGNASQPPVQYIPAIIRFLGYNPFPAADTFPERLATARRTQGMAQKQLATALGVDPTTVRDWENGRHRPTRKKMVLIAPFLFGTEGRRCDNAQENVCSSETTTGFIGVVNHRPKLREA